MKKHITPLAMLLAMAAASTDVAAQVNPYKQTFGTDATLANVKDANGVVTTSGGVYSPMAGTGSTSIVINSGVQPGIGTGSQYYLASAATGNSTARNSRLLVSNISQVTPGHFYAAFNVKTDLPVGASFQFYTGDGGVTGLNSNINNPVIATAVRITHVSQDVYELASSLNGSSWSSLGQFSGSNPISRIELYANIQTTSATYFRGTCSLTSEVLPAQTFHVYVNGGSTAYSAPTGGLSNGNGSNDQINDMAFVTNDANAKAWIDNVVYAADLNRPRLVGTYVMDPDGNDPRPTTYPSLYAAISGLNCLNTGGAVTFQVTANTPLGTPIVLGEYDHALTLEGNNSTLSHCDKYASNVNMIRLNGTDNVTIRGFNLVATCTYGTGILMTGGTQNVTIEDNIINVQVPGPMSASAHNNGIVALAPGSLHIINNQILGGRRGIIIQNATAPVSISENQLSGAFEYGIGLSNVPSPVVFKNTIQMLSSTFTSVGIQSAQIRGFNFDSNYITNARRSGIIIDNSNMGTGASQSYVVNNRIGDFQAGTGSTTGIYMQNVGGTNIDHNSIWINTQASSGAPFFSNFNTGLKVRNNIFAYTGDGAAYAMYNYMSTIADMRNNNFYRPSTISSNFVLQGTQNRTLADLALMDLADESFVVDPEFTANMLTGNTQLRNVGTSTVLVPFDCLGNERGTAAFGRSDIGAYEMPASGTRFAGTAAVEVNAQVYPNPFSSALTLNLNEMQAGQVQVLVTDLMGRQVYSQTYNVEAGASTLAVQTNEQIAQGVYMLQVRQGDAVSTFRVVKQ